MNLKEYLNENSIIDEIPNNNYLTEAGFSRIIQKIKQENNDFAVISAYRNKFDKKENIQRNRKLRSEFNKRKMGVYQLVGHWQECEIEGIDYEDCPKNKLVDVIERSYLVIKPQDMAQEEFKKLIQDLTNQFQQDASVLSLDGNIYIIESTGKLSKIGDKITIDKINQAYSQHVKKMKIPFVFESEVPSSYSGRMVFKENNILYPKIYNKQELREFK